MGHTSTKLCSGCLFWYLRGKWNVFYERSSGWQRARPVPNLRVAVVMTGAGMKMGGDNVLSLFCLVFVYPRHISPLLFILSSFHLSFPIPDLFRNLSLSRPSLLTPSPSSFSPTVNLWLSKPVVSAGGMILKRGVRVNLFLIPAVRNVSLYLANVLGFLAAAVKWLNKKGFLNAHWTESREISHWLWRSRGVIHQHKHCAHTFRFTDFTADEL